MSLAGSKRCILLGALGAATLAVPHALPPVASTFMLQRIWLTLSRAIQGLPEFASFSLLSSTGLLSPGAQFVTTVLVTILLAAALRRMSQSHDEAADVLPALAFTIGVFNLLSAYAGGTLVGIAQECLVGSPGTSTQRVVAFDEHGWQPGAHYFLLYLDSQSNRWDQIAYQRLDAPSQAPCADVDVVFSTKSVYDSLASAFPVAYLKVAVVNNHILQVSVQDPAYTQLSEQERAALSLHVARTANAHLSSLPLVGQIRVQLQSHRPFPASIGGRAWTFVFLRTQLELDASLLPDSSKEPSKDSSRTTLGDAPPTFGRSAAADRS